MKIRRVALIGLGAMGSYFVPGFTKYFDREDFAVIAGGSRKERLETKGVSINDEVYRPMILEPGQPMPEKQGAPAYPDLILIATKFMGLPQAVKDIRALVGPETIICSVMNGTTSEEQVAAAYGWEHVMYSFMRVSIVMKDGVTRWNPKLGAMYFGEKTNIDADGNPVYSERVQAVRELMDGAGIRYRIPKDMLKAIWYKFMSNVGENLTCALLGIPFGGFHWNENANWIRISAMREVVAVAQARGIALSEKDIEIQNQQVLQIPPENKPSTLQDIEAGKKTEIDMFAGDVIRMGEQSGVPTPVCVMLYHGIRALEEKNDRAAAEH